MRHQKCLKREWLRLKMNQRNKMSLPGLSEEESKRLREIQREYNLRHSRIILEMPRLEYKLGTNPVKTAYFELITVEDPEDEL